MQSSKEEQGEVRKPSSVISANKQKKTLEWETGDHFKKIRDTKGTFNAKFGSVKDRNVMDLTEEKYIKKRWQEQKEELFKKYLHDPDNHHGMITHLEQTSCNEKSTGSQDASLQTKLVEALEYQLSYFKP